MTGEKMSVHEAWSCVMRDVQAIGKDQRNNAPNANYNFRGIDAVMNKVGPILRTHGVFVVPEDATASYRDVLTSTGKPSREATVMVHYRVYGPQGDSFGMCSPGEAMDSGDKGTPKAMSVAYRTVLLQSLTIPTDDPDPDSQTYERAVRPPADPLMEAKNRLWPLAVARWSVDTKDHLAAYAVEHQVDLNSAAQIHALADEWEAAA